MTPEQHRLMNTLIIGLVSIAVFIGFIASQHSIEDCEDRLYKKLTEQKEKK